MLKKMDINFKFAHAIEMSEPLRPSIEPLDVSADDSALTIGGNDFLQRIGSTLLHSIQLGYAAPHQAAAMPAAFMPDKVTPSIELSMETSNLGNISDSHKQMEYDKFMNEVWIGIVLTLVLISMVFCICSCLLYHQFRTWKRNYHRTLSLSAEADVEALKVYPSEFNDPVPEYALVSGLPTYEAALELLQSKSTTPLKKLTSNTCQIHSATTTTTTTASTTLNNNEMMMQQQQQQISTYEQEPEIVAEVTPLLTTTTTTSITAAAATKENNQTCMPVTLLTSVNEKPKLTVTSILSTSNKALEKLQDNNTLGNNNDNINNNNKNDEKF